MSWLLEYVVGDAFFRDAEAVEQGPRRIDHERRTAEIIFHRGGIRVFGEIFISLHFSSLGPGSQWIDIAGKVV